VSNPCPIYLAAPIAAPTLGDQLANCARANMIAGYLRRRGHEVICVHEQAALDLLHAGGETPEARAVALVRCLALVRQTIAAGGRVAVLMRDDGTFSAGVALEREQARQAWVELGEGSTRGRGWEHKRMTWQGWLDTPGFFG
jgi:hypothetical protein